MEELAKYGLAGVSIALIIALVIIVKAVLKIFANHIVHNTSALTKLIEIIDDLKEWLKLNGKK